MPKVTQTPTHLIDGLVHTSTALVTKVNSTPPMATRPHSPHVAKGVAVYAQTVSGTEVERLASIYSVDTSDHGQGACPMGASSPCLPLLHSAKLSKLSLPWTSKTITTTLKYPYFTGFSTLLSCFISFPYPETATFNKTIYSAFSKKLL